VACWSNEVEECMDAVVAEATVSLNPRLFGQNVIVLLLEVSKDLLETSVLDERGWTG